MVGNGEVGAGASRYGQRETSPPIISVTGRQGITAWFRTRSEEKPQLGGVNPRIQPVAPQTAHAVSVSPVPCCKSRIAMRPHLTTPLPKHSWQAVRNVSSRGFGIRASPMAFTVGHER